MTPSADLVMRRLSYGATDALAAEIGRLGVRRWIDQQLDPAAVPDDGGRRVDDLFPEVFASPEALAAQVDRKAQPRGALQAHHLGRAVWSRHQLFEVMVDFWSNHFNVAIGAGGKSPLLRPHYQVHAVRAHALGRFGDLLVATAEHPAMLLYLNGAQSSRQAPNENFARELLELHTLGVSGGYTENDVKQAALLLTGWTVPGTAGGKQGGGAATTFSQAVFRPERHFVGPVTVLGRQYPNAKAEDGVAAGRELLAALAAHPSTASHIAFKLARRFVADTPSQALVARLAQVYLDHDTQILPVLRALVGSPEFAGSSGQKVRRPFERVAATLRVLAPTTAGVSADGLLAGVRTMTAQRPFDWATPDGHPDVLEVWSSPGAAVDLLNYGSRLVAGTLKGLGSTAAVRFAAAGPTTATAAAEAAARIVLLRPPTAAERAAVLHLLAGSVPATFRPGSAEQTRAGLLAQSLLLASPSHLTR